MTDTISQLRKKVRAAGVALTRHRKVKAYYENKAAWTRIENDQCTRLAEVTAELESEIRNQNKE